MLWSIGLPSVYHKIPRKSSRFPYVFAVVFPRMRDAPPILSTGIRLAPSRRAALLAQGDTCVGVFEKPPGNDCDFGIAPATVLAGKHRKKGENFPGNEKDGLQEKLTDHLMARPRGFEPPTYRFVAGHSIR